VNPIHVVGGVVGRVRREIVVARFVGQIAVERTVAEIRRQLGEEPATPPEPAGGAASAPPSPPRMRTEPDDPAPAVRPDPDADADVPAVADLALPDYDLLPAAHIVNALVDLEPDERDAIATYERAGRHRRTILGKLALLADVADEAAT
jgi:hypothetical protein